MTSGMFDGLGKAIGVLAVFACIGVIALAVLVATVIPWVWQHINVVIR